MKDKKISSHDAILEAGFALFSRDPGTSLADIATHAGVGRATLHRHFAGRDDLMVALAKTAMAELEAAVALATKDAQNHTEALRLTMNAVLPLAHRQKFLALERVVEEALGEAYEDSYHQLCQTIEGAKSEGSFPAYVQTEWIAGIYENLIYAGWELVEDGEATPKQASAFVWQVLMKGAGV